MSKTKPSSGAEKSGHGVPYKSSHPEQTKIDAQQAAQHGRDMARVERMHKRGLKKAEDMA